MNKSDLISAMADKAGISKAKASDALEAFMDSTASALKNGEKLVLVGFGTFSVNKRAARAGRNPRTGKEIQISAKNVVKFKAGAGLSENVN